MAIENLGSSGKIFNNLFLLDTCEFSSETDEVIEGGEVKLNLTFTKKLSEDVDIEIQYSGINNLASKSCAVIS